MKSSFLTCAALLVVPSFASAENLLLNFYSTSTETPASGPVADPYFTLSPAHVVGGVTGTTWNNFNSVAGSNSLLYGNGAAATGVSITFGQESSAGSGSIDYTLTSGINVAALYGTGGGTTGQQSFVGNPLSIYGDGNNAGNSAPGRAGWLGPGITAIGMRIDGLAAGEYTIYVMGRNTNANQNERPMDFFAAAGPSDAAFDFSALTGTTSANPAYPNTQPEAYNTFIEGENFVAITITIGEGDSLFLASDGASANETRGFFNMVEIVAVPEPGTWMLLGLGLGLVAVLRIRRRAVSID